MRSGVAPFYCLFVLFIFCTVSASYDNANIAVIEVPSTELNDSDQKPHCELEYHDKDDVTGVQDTEELTEMQRGDELTEISRSERRPSRLLKSSVKSWENNFVLHNPVVPERSFSSELVSNEDIYFNNFEHLKIKDDVKTPDLLSTYPKMPFTLIRLLGPPIVLPPEYAMDILNNPNTYLDDNLILNKQSSRRHLGEFNDQDFLEQLEHDAIIPNILPTMEAPFFRAAYPSQEVLQKPSLARSDAVAYFPEAHGVQIPIILTCSPKITQGYQQNLQVPLPYYNSRETYWQSPSQMDGYKK